MASPKLSVARSNYEGRGYADVFNLNNGMPVPSVTTVLKSLSEEGLIQWAVEQTAAYAVMNVDKLAQIPDEKGFALLRYYWKRMNSAKVDDPWTDLNNYHTGVLKDTAQMGTWIHTFIEAHMNKWDLPEPERIEHEQMANAYLEWCQENFVTVYATEATVFGNGYAGTSDWFAEVNGVKYLGDNKSSRAVRNSHLAQLGALGAGHTMAKEVTADTPGAFKHLMEPKVAEELGLDRETYWEPVPLPDFTNYGILQVRPDDYDSKGNFVPAFCQFHPVPQEVVEAAFEVFKGGLAVAYGNLAVKKAMKETGFGH